MVLIYCTQPIASEIKSPIYLKAPMVHWEENRLTGELKNIPVSKLLKDLISNGNFDCKISGQLPGSISIRFENLTTEEIIHKIMRSNNYSYTLLSTSAETEKYSNITMLTIYQGDNVISFNRVPYRNQPALTASVPSPAKKTDKRKAAPPDVDYAKGIKKLDQDIKGFLDEMLAANEMSREEYEKALTDIKTKAKIN